MDAQPNVVLLTHIPDPERIVSAASRLCYSSAAISEWIERVSQKETPFFANAALIKRTGSRAKDEQP